MTLINFVTNKTILVQKFEIQNSESLNLHNLKMFDSIDIHYLR